MAIKRLTCPACGIVLKSTAVPDPGTRITCRECGKAFRVPEDELNVEAIQADDSRRPLRIKPGREDSDDEGDQPDEEVRPRKKQKKAASNVAVWVLLAGGVIVLAVVLVGILAATLFFLRNQAMMAVNEAKPKPPIVVDNQPAPKLIIKEQRPVQVPPIFQDNQPVPKPQPPMIKVKPPEPVPTKKEKEKSKDDEWGPPLSPLVPIFREARASFKAHDKVVTCLAVSPDGTTLASCSGDSTIRLWDLKSNTERVALLGHKGMVHVLAFSPDGKTLASAGSDKFVFLWKLETKKAIPLRGLHSDIHALAFSPDSKTIAAGSTAQVKTGNNVIGQRVDILTWDVATGDERDEWQGRLGTPIAMAFLEEGKLLAVASEQGELVLWDLASKSPKVSVKAHAEGLIHMAASADGKLLVTGGRDQTAKIWDAGGKELATFAGHKSTVGRVAFSRDGQWLATANSAKYGGDSFLNTDEVLLWDVRDKKPLTILQAERGALATAVFNLDGATLITGGQDGIIRLWNVPAPGSLKPLDPSPQGAADSAGAFILQHGGKMQRQGSEIVQVKLSGAKLADADLDLLKDLKWLRRLWLDGVPITGAGLQRLKSCRQLEKLSIIRTKVTEKEASAFKKALPGCYIHWSDDDLENAMINQNYNLAAAIKEFGGGFRHDGNGDLVELNLGQKQRKITDAGLRHLQGLTKIKELHLYGQPDQISGITDAGVAQLRGLKSLENLGLGWTKITDAALVFVNELPNLQYLDLQFTAVTDAGLLHLKGMQKLEGVYVARSKITPKGAHALKQYLPKCNVIGDSSFR